MQLSELINHLLDVHAIQGDLEVVLYDENSTTPHEVFCNPTINIIKPQGMSVKLLEVAAGEPISRKHETR